MQDLETLKQAYLTALKERWLHAESQGSGVRVAIIDSGIDRVRLRDRQVTRGAELNLGEVVTFRAGEKGANPQPDQPSGPHGTIVADVLLRQAPAIELFSADVFGPTGLADVESVQLAIEYAVYDWKCRIVNLSLGIPENRLQLLAKRHALQRVIEQGYHQGVLFFAAAHNEHPIVRSFPSLFSPALISVDKGEFALPEQFAYSPREEMEFQAFSRGYLGPFAKEPATSWATPHLAGLAARLVGLYPDLKAFELKTILYWLTRK